jgi:hypothetical protein
VLDAHELTKKKHVCISQLKIVSAKYKFGYQKLSKSEKLSKFDFDLVFLREGQVCDLVFLREGQVNALRTHY